MHVPEYEANSLVRIEAEAPYIAFEKGAFRQDSGKYVQTQIELLRSPVVLAPVLSREEIAGMQELKSQVDPLKHLQDHLIVKQVGQSELYEVAYKSHSPSDAATVANVVVAEYLALQNREERQRSQIVIDVLEKERVERGTRVDQLRKRVVEMSKEVTGRDPFAGVVTDVSAFSSAASVFQSLTATDVAVEVLKAELQALNEAPIVTEDKTIASGLLDLEISNRPEVRSMQDRISKIRQEITQIKTKPRLKIGDTWEDDPEYLRLEKELKQQKSDMAELKSIIKEELLKLRREEREIEHKRLVDAKQRELHTLLKKRELLAEKMEEQMAELRSDGAQSAELEFAKAELNREQKVFELIAARKLALQTEQRAPARVTMMQSANVPNMPLELLPYKYLLMACLISLVCPLALAVAYEVAARRITSPEQLSGESALPVLGEVTRLPRRQVSTEAQPFAIPHSKERHVFAESIDALRTQLMLTEEVGLPGQQKVLAICSAASGEGKSSLAATLALSLAEATNQPTLVIDADLRAPDIAGLLEVPNRPGLAELLEGKATLEQSIYRVRQTQTYVLPAGKLFGNPHHVFEDFKIDKLLEELRKSFATIIIDTPPVLAASDSLMYAKSSDLVLFCSLAETSRAKQVRVAVERLNATGARLAGAVLSGVPAKRYAYNYGVYARDEED